MSSDQAPSGEPVAQPSSRPPVRLQLTGVESGYGPLQVLRQIDLRVGEREIVTVIGANGAGKTTLLNTIIGMVPSRGGSIVLDGASLTGRATESIVRMGIAQIPERRQLFPSLTVEENLILGAYHRARTLGRAGMRREVERINELFPRLRERRHQKAGTLSGGEQQMVAIGRGLLSDPSVLLLDEPSLGLAPIMTREIVRTIVGLRDQGLCILLVEQNARLALEISDYCYVLAVGEIVLQGPSEELMQDPRVQESYLGMAVVETAPSTPGGSPVTHP